MLFMAFFMIYVQATKIEDKNNEALLKTAKVDQETTVNRTVPEG